MPFSVQLVALRVNLTVMMSLFPITTCDVIVENKVPENSIEISLQECKRKLKDCFCDSEGRIYPEFERVIPPKDSPNRVAGGI